MKKKREKKDMLIHVDCWSYIMHSHIRLKIIYFKAFFVISPKVVILFSRHSDQRHISTSEQLSLAVLAWLSLSDRVDPGNH